MGGYGCNASVPLPFFPPMSQTYQVGHVVCFVGTDKYIRRTNSTQIHERRALSYEQENAFARAPDSPLREQHGRNNIS